MAAHGVSLLYVSVLGHTVVGPWNLVQLALQLVLLQLQFIFLQEETERGVLASLPQVGNVSDWQQPGQNMSGSY